MEDGRFPERVVYIPEQNVDPEAMEEYDVFEVCTSCGSSMCIALSPKYRKRVDEAIDIIMDEEDAN